MTTSPTRPLPQSPPPAPFVCLQLDHWTADRAPDMPVVALDPPEWDTHWRHNGHSVKDREAPSNTAAARRNARHCRLRHSQHRGATRTLDVDACAAAGATGTEPPQPRGHPLTRRRRRHHLVVSREPCDDMASSAHLLCAPAIPKHLLTPEYLVTDGPYRYFAEPAVRRRLPDVERLGRPPRLTGRCVRPCCPLPRPARREFGSRSVVSPDSSESQWKGYASAVPRFIGRRA